MTFHWYRLGVLVLWLAAMSWLVARKVLPPLLIGEPPVYASMAADKPQPPVAWFLDFNHTRVGWAISEITRQSTDVTELYSLIHFDGLPLEQLLPAYMRELASAGIQSIKGVQLEVESHMLINPLNQLQSFDSRLKFHPYAGQSLIAIEGNVDNDKLKLAFRIGDKPQEKLEFSMPESKIRDSFAPETELQRLHQGQSWTLVTYSPLASSPLDLLEHRAPTEVLLARVEEQTAIMWSGHMEPVWLVVYRSDANQADDDKNVRNRLWVRMDGTVVREEVLLSGNSLLFSRMSADAVARLRNERKEFFGRK